MPSTSPSPSPVSARRAAAREAAASIRIGFLAGDVNQNRVVTVSDLVLVNAQIAHLVTAANYLKDVNATGTLTVSDKADHQCEPHQSTAAAGRRGAVGGVDRARAECDQRQPRAPT